MEHNEKPKVGAPKKESPKKKISITVDCPLLESAQQKAVQDNESFSARVARALELLEEKERKPHRRGRGLAPNRGNTDRA